MPYEDVANKDQARTGGLPMHPREADDSPDLMEPILGSKQGETTFDKAPGEEADGALLKFKHKFSPGKKDEATSDGVPGGEAGKVTVKRRYFFRPGNKDESTSMEHEEEK